jgi:uncharacterized protein
MNKKRSFRMLAAFLFIIPLVGFSFPFMASGEEYKLTVASGVIGGGWYTSMAGLFDIVHTNTPDIKAQIVPGAGMSNQPRVGTKEADLAWGISPFVIAATKGESPFDKAYKDIRCIINANDIFALQFIVARDFPFNKIEDILAKKYPIKLAVVPEGVSDAYAFRKLLEFYKVDIKTVESWGGKIMRAGYPDQVQLMQDKHVEALFENTFVPSNPVLQLQPFRKLKYLPLEKRLIEYFSKLGFIPWEIPANAYQEQTVPVPTVSNSSVLIVNSKVPDDAVYKITKILVEKAADIKRIPTLENWDPKKGIKNLPGPLHPGAEKYYKEKGLL